MKQTQFDCEMHESCKEKGVRGDGTHNNRLAVGVACSQHVGVV